MKIRLASFQLGLNTATELVTSESLGIDGTIYPEPLTVTLTVDKGVGKAHIRVRTEGVGRFICDRCDEEFSQVVAGEVAVVFIQRDAPFPEEQPGDDLRSFMQFQEELDITTEVRDALMLELPLKMLCSEDCKGLCASCGANLNNETCRCQKKAPSEVD